MDRETVQKTVRVTLALLGRIVKRTRTQADDLMAAMLQANEARLVEAVLKFLSSSDLLPEDERIAQALDSVGIKV